MNFSITKLFPLEYYVTKYTTKYSNEKKPQAFKIIKHYSNFKLIKKEKYVIMYNTSFILKEYVYYKKPTKENYNTLIKSYYPQTGIIKNETYYMGDVIHRMPGEACIDYYPDGKVKRTTNFNLGPSSNNTGITEYYPNQRIKTEILKINGRLHDTVNPSITHYNEAGYKISEEYYENNTLVQIDRPYDRIILNQQLNDILISTYNLYVEHNTIYSAINGDKIAECNDSNKEQIIKNLILQRIT